VCTDERDAEAVAELESDVVLLSSETATNVGRESLSDVRHSVEAQRRRDVGSVVDVVETSRPRLKDGSQ